MDRSDDRIPVEAFDAKEIFSHVDHTLLRADAEHIDYLEAARIAAGYGAAALCVPIARLKDVHAAWPELNLAAVIGFPFGYDGTASKVFQAMQAVQDGARELDMMIDLADVHDRAFYRVINEISAVRDAAPDAVLKVIVETCYLSEREKYDLCDIIAMSDADYIKTSTGFGPLGAQVEDVKLFRERLPERVKIKAAGGIRSREQMIALLEAGADRLGCSNAWSVLFGPEAGSAEKSAENAEAPTEDEQ